MYIYSFNWSWYEDYRPCLLLNNKKLTESEFKWDCIKALREVGEDYLRTEIAWVSAPDWIKKACDYMVKQLGYSYPTITSFGHFGSYIIWGEDETDALWKSLVGEELYKLALEHNKKLEK